MCIKRVLCIKSHSQGVVKEGRIYTVQGEGICDQCGMLSYDIGVPSGKRAINLCECGYVSTEKYWSVGAELFIDLQDRDLMVQLNIMEELPEQLLIATI